MTVSTLNAKFALDLAGTLLRRRSAVPLRRGPRLTLEPHPNAPDPTNLVEVRRWVRRAHQPTAVDIFSGAGGLSLGLAQAGFSVLVGADWDPVAVETHVANLGGLGYTGDLGDPSEFLDHLAAWGISKVDLVAGGVPCQPFSRAGKSKIRSLVDAKVRSSSDSRVDLWRGFVQVVQRLRPRAVLLENVPDLAQWDDGAVLVGFLESLSDLGYRTDARILNAYDYGVPQHRSRLFIVGLLNDASFAWPSASPKRPPTLWDAISDLPAVPPGQRQERLAYGRPLTPLQRRMRKGVSAADRRWIHDHITREVRPDDAEAFALLSEGGTYRDVPAHLRRYRSDIFTDKYKRLSRHELSRTITAHLARDGYWYIHPDQDRTLSVREAARVQAFPDWFRFAGEPSLRYRQIGNAVPPLLAEAIGQSLVGALDRHVRRTHVHTHSFRTDLLVWHASNSRQYPWRSGGNPWTVLLAEMCLRRTRADQVAAIYERLIAMAPNPISMQQKADKVRELLTPLGLRWRVDNILEVANVILERHDGKVPDSREQLTSLPGVGDYVANAVLCFGYGRAAILMDTNTQRIASRVMGRDPKQRVWQTRLDLYRLAGSDGAGPDMNYALLDLGALVCRASTPRCPVCPVADHCLTFSADN